MALGELGCRGFPGKVLAPALAWQLPLADVMGRVPVIPAQNLGPKFWPSFRNYS